MSYSVLPMFSSTSFIVSGLTFRSLMHFNFFLVVCVCVCVCGVRKRSNSIPCRCLIFPAPFIEETVFSLVYVFASFVEDKVPIGAWIYLWAFYLYKCRPMEHIGP